MIRIDQVWLSTEYFDMRCGMDTTLSRVEKVFGAAHVRDHLNGATQ